MKGPPSTYLDLIADIKPLEQRRNAKTKKDTFDLQLWWREAASKIPAGGVGRRCCALCSPTRPTRSCFSILNDSFDDDQTGSGADYIEHSIQSQYNARGRA